MSWRGVKAFLCLSLSCQIPGGIAGWLSYDFDSTTFDNYNNPLLMGGFFVFAFMNDTPY